MLRLTENYDYVLKFDFTPENVHMHAGQDNDPSFSITVPYVELDTAILNKMNNLKDSFSKELLNDVILVIRHDYPHIRRIQLTDEYERMYYSVALYTKTWYEQTFNAYLPTERFAEYKHGIERYANRDTKRAWDWGTFYREIRISRNEFAISMIVKHHAEIQDMYSKAETFPDFFIKLSKSVPIEDKCRFFRGWLESFVESFVVIPRTWFIDLYTV